MPWLPTDETTALSWLDADEPADYIISSSSGRVEAQVEKISGGPGGNAVQTVVSKQPVRTVRAGRGMIDYTGVPAAGVSQFLKTASYVRQLPLTFVQVRFEEVIPTNQSVRWLMQDAFLNAGPYLDHIGGGIQAYFTRVGGGAALLSAGIGSLTLGVHAVMSTAVSGGLEEIYVDDFVTPKATKTPCGTAGINYGVTYGGPGTGIGTVDINCRGVSMIFQTAATLALRQQIGDFINSLGYSGLNVVT